jgi:hypothetical protein
MKKISLLSLVLTAGCMDWISVIPDDFVVAEAGPVGAVTDTGSAGTVDAGSSGCDPTPEECDGRDNDCDGQVDEDGVCPPPDSGPRSDAGSSPTPADAGPAGERAYSLDAPCYSGEYAGDMTLCMRFNGNFTNRATNGVQKPDGQSASYVTLAGGNKAFEFSADRYLLADPGRADLYNRAMTLAARVKPNNTSGVVTVFSAQAMDGDGQIQGPFRLELDSGRPKVSWLNEELTGASPLPTDSFTHLMVVFHDRFMRLYRSGELVGIHETASELAGRASAGYVDGIGVHLNAHDASASSPFNGAIDDLRVWNKAQPAQFLALEAGRWVDTPSVVEGWNCEEGSQPDVSGDLFGFGVPCVKTYFATPQQPSSVRVTVHSEGPPMGDGENDPFKLEFGDGSDEGAIVVGYDSNNYHFRFGTDDGLENVDQCGFGMDMFTTEVTVILSFDWDQNEVTFSCQGEDPFEPAMTIPENLRGGVNSLRVAPDPSSGEIGLSDIIWQL